MFENEKEITIIEDIGFNFYKGKYVEEGLEIYKNGNILREMEELRNEVEQLKEGQMMEIIFDGR